MKKSRKTITAKQVLNEVGVDVSPRPLAQWSTHSPIEEFEHIFLEVTTDSKHKKKYLGSKHRPKSSTSASTEPDDEKNLRWYFETKLWLPSEPETSKISVILKEEGPFWFLDLTDYVVPKESDEYNAVVTRNQNYLQLLESKFGSEKYIDRGSITIHHSRKTKILQTDDIVVEHMNTQVSPYNFYESDKQSFTPQTFNTKVCDLNLTDAASGGLTFAEDNRIKKVSDEELLNNSNILKACVYVERILQFNQYYSALAMFRNEPLIYDDVEDTSSMGTYDSAAKKTGFIMPTKAKSMTTIMYGHLYLRHLWTFHSNMFTNFSVTSICFNHANNDLLAAGYYNKTEQQTLSGYVGCWSIKNIEHPERYFKTESGVSVVAFSEINPFMLAVGFFNGGLSFYNVSTPIPSILFSSFTIGQGHKNPVSALKWITKNGYEVLITTSTDGRVLLWSFLNGLQCKEILRLKSMHSKNNTTDQLSSGDYDGGLCFDFSSDQSEIYLIGTDSGFIYKCSTIHANQFFKTYSGHIAPVYKIKWSHENPDMFASCSADMTVKIWHQDRSKALHDLLPINPPNSPAFDLAWCPDRYGILLCIFGTELQVWDLLANKLDPIFIHRIEDPVGNIFTCLSYALQSNCVYFGNVYGDILVHQMVENILVKEHKEKDIMDLSLFQD